MLVCSSTSTFQTQLSNIQNCGRSSNIIGIEENGDGAELITTKGLGRQCLLLPVAGSTLITL